LFFSFEKVSPMSTSRKTVALKRTAKMRIGKTWKQILLHVALTRFKFHSSYFEGVLKAGMMNKW